MNDLSNELNINLEKAGKEPIGAVATWADGKQYRKVAEGQWEPDKSEKSRNAKLSGGTHGYGHDDVSTATKLHDRFMDYLQNMSKEHRDIFRGGKFDWDKKQFIAQGGNLALEWKDNKVTIVKLNNLKKAATMNIQDNVIAFFKAFGGKKDVSKLIKKQITDKKGRRTTVYVKTGAEQKEEKKGILEIIAEFFGFSKSTPEELHKHIHAEYTAYSKDKSEAAIDEKGFQTHFLEYFKHKARWDSKLSGKKEGGEHKERAVKSESKGEGGKERQKKDWNMDVMKYLHGLYGGKSSGKMKSGVIESKEGNKSQLEERKEINALKEKRNKMKAGAKKEELADKIKKMDADYDKKYPEAGNGGAKIPENIIKKDRSDMSFDEYKKDVIQSMMEKYDKDFVKKSYLDENGNIKPNYEERLKAEWEKGQKKKGESEDNFETMPEVDFSKDPTLRFLTKNVINAMENKAEGSEVPFDQLKREMPGIEAYIEKYKSKSDDAKERYKDIYARNVEAKKIYDRVKSNFETKEEIKDEKALKRERYRLADDASDEMDEGKKKELYKKIEEFDKKYPDIKDKILNPSKYKSSSPVKEEKGFDPNAPEKFSKDYESYAEGVKSDIKENKALADHYLERIQKDIKQSERMIKSIKKEAQGTGEDSTNAVSKFRERIKDASILSKQIKEITGEYKKGSKSSPDEAQKEDTGDKKSIDYNNPGSLTDDQIFNHIKDTSKMSIKQLDKNANIVSQQLEMAEKQGKSEKVIKKLEFMGAVYRVASMYKDDKKMSKDEIVSLVDTGADLNRNKFSNDMPKDEPEKKYGDERSEKDKKKAIDRYDQAKKDIKEIEDDEWDISNDGKVNGMSLDDYLVDYLGEKEYWDENDKKDADKVKRLVESKVNYNKLKDEAMAAEGQGKLFEKSSDPIYGTLQRTGGGRILLKAFGERDKSKLVKKQVVDKNGKRTTVYVSAGDVSNKKSKDERVVSGEIKKNKPSNDKEKNNKKKPDNNKKDLMSKDEKEIKEKARNDKREIKKRTIKDALKSIIDALTTTQAVDEADEEMVSGTAGEVSGGIKDHSERKKREKIEIDKAKRNMKERRKKRLEQKKKEAEKKKEEEKKRQEESRKNSSAQK